MALCSITGSNAGQNAQNNQTCSHSAKSFLYFQLCKVHFLMATYLIQVFYNFG